MSARNGNMSNVFMFMANNSFIIVTHVDAEEIYRIFSTIIQWHLADLDSRFPECPLMAISGHRGRWSKSNHGDIYEHPA